MSSCRQGLHTFGRGDYVTYMKHEGAELKAQPDVVVWGVCVHHASGGEGEGEGGEEGGGGGKTQGRKWLVLCEVGRDHCGPFFVGKWTEWQRVRARGVSAESFDPDNDEHVKRMSVELCNVCVTAWGELFAGELTGSPEAAWKQAEHPPPSTKEQRSKDAQAQKAKESAERAEQQRQERLRGKAGKGGSGKGGTGMGADGGRGAGGRGSSDGSGDGGGGVSAAEVQKQIAAAVAAALAAQAGGGGGGGGRGGGSGSGTCSGSGGGSDARAGAGGSSGRGGGSSGGTRTPQQRPSPPQHSPSPPRSLRLLKKRLRELRAAQDFQGTAERAAQIAAGEDDLEERERKFRKYGV